MDQGLIALLLVAVIALLGALLQTFKPDFISEATSNALSAMTLALVGIFLSVNGVRLALALNAREGFEDLNGIDKWKAMVKTYELEEICSFYTDVYEKIRTVEKGAPPGEVLTDAQAREKTDQRFTVLMSVPQISCKKVSEAVAAKTESDLAEKLSVLPDSLFVQAYQTIDACRSLLIQSYKDMILAELRAKEEQEKKEKEKEGFETEPEPLLLCTEAEIQERREVAKQPLEKQAPLSEKAQSCQLAEEVVASKLNTFQSTFQTYQNQGGVKDSFSTILQDCRFWKQKLEEKSKETVDKSNSYVFR